MIRSCGLGSLYAVDVQISSFCTLNELCRAALASRDVRSFMQRCQVYETVVTLPNSTTDACTQQLLALGVRFTSITFKSCTALTDIGVLMASHNSPQLVHISLDGCTQVTDAGLHELAQHCTRLTRISLDECELMTDVGIESLAQNCRHLTHISVDNCHHMTDIALTALAIHCPQLIDINFGGTSFMSLTNDGLRAVAINCHLLQTFCVHGCDSVTDSGLLALTSTCHQLKSISFGCTAVGDAGLQAVANNCKGRLISLNMDHCDISDHGLTVLATQCDQLTEIGMSDLTKITEDGLLNLARSCHHLVSIGMAGCPVTERGLMAFATHCPQLKDIEVDACLGLRKLGTRLRVANRYPHLRKCLIDDFHIARFIGENDPLRRPCSRELHNASLWIRMHGASRFVQQLLMHRRNTSDAVTSRITSTQNRVEMP